VNIRTFTGQIAMRNVGMADQLAGLIEEQLVRSKQVAQKVETEALERTIRARLGLPVENAPAATIPPPPQKGKTVRKPGGLNRMFSDFFKVRFEESGTVTFRKHWIMLLALIWKQTLIILGLVALMVTRAFDIFDMFTPLTIYVFGITFLLIAIAWWLYGYVDWRNDLYQVTSDQIIDIYRKPLGREDKKSAPIENILSLEHERIGLLGLLLNYGNVVAMVGGTRFTFDGVFDPPSVQQEIFERINARKRQQKEAEATRERERIADWMAAYHRQAEAARRMENPTKFDRNSG